MPVAVGVSEKGEREPGREHHRLGRDSVARPRDQQQCCFRGFRYEHYPDCEDHAIFALARQTFAAEVILTDSRQRRQESYSSERNTLAQLWHWIQTIRFCFSSSAFDPESCEEGRSVEHPDLSGRVCALHFLTTYGFGHYLFGDPAV